MSTYPTTHEAERHERTYTWTDPTQLIATVGTRSGVDMLRAITDGSLPRPPVLDLLAIDPGPIDEGHVQFTMTPQPWHYNPLGSVHGGILATLADTALGCAVHSALPADVGYTTLEIKVNYIKTVTSRTGTLTADGNLLALGGRTATAEARITTPDGTLVCHATTTCVILRSTRQGNPTAQPPTQNKTQDTDTASGR